MLIHLIVAARPNFMKIAPLYYALKKEDWAVPIIVHTGQHYDLNMSDAFFQDLGLPEPDLHLGIGSGTHAGQTSQVMIAYEKALLERRPDLIVVVGDVNSTIACALVASKISYKPTNPSNSINHPKRPLIAHLEAGLRSFDRTMPEEINRLVTDAVADILWTPSPDADDNLIREGVIQEKIHRVGNIMIDSIEMLRQKIQKQAVYEEFGFKPGDFGLVTLHRPSNVDDPELLKQICQTLTRIAQTIPLIFPIHPRTLKNLQQNGLMSLLKQVKGLLLLKPLSYIRFMNLVFNCRFTITDSGGIQGETTYLGIPCLTIRPNTEWPITINHGTNHLCTLENLEKRVEATLAGKAAQGSTPEFWDGKTANRVVKTIKSLHPQWL
ncbi:MAG: UDP-N-acetylglucosamine 2-epimerase (non-hydrolyzing) [Deltaproteobacteria bacterium]|nr:UDP-N-acetylglucosamine 2-epimerase (non-hydrolyzing) [Deltaproteobacteria bacterium]